MKKTTLSVIVIMLVLVSCEQNQADETELFSIPLSVGNKWTYQVNAATAPNDWDVTLVREIMNEIVVHSRTYYRMTSTYYVNGERSDSFWWQDVILTNDPDSGIVFVSLNSTNNVILNSSTLFDPKVKSSEIINDSTSATFSYSTLNLNGIQHAIVRADYLSESPTFQTSTLISIFASDEIGLIGYEQLNSGEQSPWLSWYLIDFELK